MWNSCQKFDRLKKAIEYRGLDPNNISLNDFAKLLAKRGITDTVQNKIVWMLLEVLEPPVCNMTHCEHYGGQSSFCNCSLERIPGRCPINRDYLKRKKEREENPKTEVEKIEYLAERLGYKGYSWNYKSENVKAVLKHHGKTLDEGIQYFKDKERAKKKPAAE